MKPQRAFDTRCRRSGANEDPARVTEGMQEVGASDFSSGNLIQTTLLLPRLTRYVPLCGVIQACCLPPSPWFNSPRAEMLQ